jgi:hypothetical protein
MHYKHLIIKILQFYFTILLVSFVLDVGYSAIKHQDFAGPFAVWVGSRFTLKRMAINLIVAACLGYYSLRKEQRKIE